MKLDIRGIQEAQRGNLQMMNAIKPANGLGRAIYSIASAAHRIAVGYTHVITGALRGSQRVIKESISRYRIFIDPTSVNPVNRGRPAIYGVIEHRRGGNHAFYERTTMQGTSLLSDGARLLLRELP